MHARHTCKHATKAHTPHVRPRYTCMHATHERTLHTYANHTNMHATLARTPYMHTGHTCSTPHIHACYTYTQHQFIISKYQWFTGKKRYKTFPSYQFNKLTNIFHLFFAKFLHCVLMPKFLKKIVQGFMNCSLRIPPA